MIGMLEETYHEMLARYGKTLEEASEDVNKPPAERFMTNSKTLVVNFDKFKNDFVKKMGSNFSPLSCDALYMASPGEFFLIEFKNGVMDNLKNNEVKIKILESLLIFTEKMDKTIGFTRKNVTFVFVYNEDVVHKYYIHGKIFSRTNNFKVDLGLGRFEKVYFKSVNVYSKAEFKTRFVEQYCI
jgi:hypothetical protein